MAMYLTCNICSRAVNGTLQIVAIPVGYDACRNKCPNFRLRVFKSAYRFLIGEGAFLRHCDISRSSVYSSYKCTTLPCRIRHGAR